MELNETEGEQANKEDALTCRDARSSTIDMTKPSGLRAAYDLLRALRALGFRVTMPETPLNR